MSDTANKRVIEAEEESIEADGESVEAESDPRDVDTSHLDDVDDGCGCAEVWEHLSEERDE